MAERHKFWTDKRKQRALAFGLGAALLLIIWLLLRKHLVAGASGSSPSLGISPTFNINGGSVPAATLQYKPGDFSIFYPALAGVQHRDGGCCCGCDDKDGDFSRGLSENINRYSAGITAAENLYIDNIFGNLAPAIRQYIGNTDYSTFVPPSNFGG